MVVIDRTRTTDEDEIPQRAFFITSLPPVKGCAARFADLARGHWGGCEIRNHWVRDSCMNEDKTRSKNYQLNCALAGLRICVLAVKSLLFSDRSWSEVQELCQRDPSVAYRAIAKLQAK